MLIYNMKDEQSIDIYTMEEKKEEAKEYRKTIIGKQKKSNLFYSLHTNSFATTRKFEGNNVIDLRHLHYDYTDSFGKNHYSDFYSMKESDSRCEAHYSVLRNYIEGTYNNIHPIITFDRFDPEIHRLLITTGRNISYSYNPSTWCVPNILNLPRRLYLLQLLLNGRFDLLTNENIEEQLQLFDISYLKYVKLSDIQEMLDTGLVSGSIDEAKEKAAIGSAILKKVKKLETN